MKKLFVIIVIIAIIMSIPVAAFSEAEATGVAVKTDSLKISEETKEKLQVKPYETAFKVYNVHIFSAFSEADSFDEVLEKDLTLGEYYAVISADGTIDVRCILDNNELYCEDNEGFGYVYPDVVKVLQDNSVISKVSPDIEVYGTYFLSGATSHCGCAIYYKTNKGDYIYYDNYEIYSRSGRESNDYLYPINEFCEIMRPYYEEKCEEYRKAHEEFIKEASKYPDWISIGNDSQSADMSRQESDTSDALNISNIDLNTDSQQPPTVGTLQPTVVDGANPSRSDSLKNMIWGIAIAGIVLAAAVGVYIGIRAHKRKA